MPVNFSLLNAIKPSEALGQVAGQTQDSGLGGLLQGVGGLLQGLKSQQQPNPQAPVNPMVQNPNSLMISPQDAELHKQGRLGQIVDKNDPFKQAQNFLGLKEFNPTLRTYLQRANPGLDPNVTPWCAGFVGSVLNSSGLKGTGSLAAKSYLNYGTPTNEPQQGDVVVLNRGNNPQLGHVGFFAGYDKEGNIQVLGGNQDDTVSVKSFSRDQLAGFRRPPSGQQVAQFAQSNNISTPHELAQAPKYMATKEELKIPNVYKTAQATYSQNPVMADLATAQAILESRLSNAPSKLALQNNNLFGIKGHGTAGTANLPTTEYENGVKSTPIQGFAANNSLADSFAQHQALMNHARYTPVRQATDFNQAAHAVQQAGYATDPSYANKLINVYNAFILPLKNI